MKVEEIEEEFVSHIIQAPREKKKPSDLLPERRSFMRRVTGTLPSPTIEELQKHVTRYGAESVVETAAELGHSLDACIRLQEHCDRAVVAEMKEQRKYIPKFSPADGRVRLILGIERESEDESS